MSLRTFGLCTATAFVMSGLAIGQMDHTNMGHSAAAPTATGPAAEAQRGYAALKVNILKAADTMPAEDYSVKPTPEVRTFARVVNHITEAQIHSCGAANGTKDMAKVPADTANKAEIVEGLKASYAECDKAYAALTDTNLTEMFTVGKAQRSRIGLMWGNVSHDNEQYATLALYMRLKGLVPPSSEK
ncbi:DinB family protein [Granulicella arctica]|uniref:DinB family protein n=1 Tax=Granulicella arctica TaxID=940613 RepID=UPI0021E0CC56|nr:DinB family protein [Granulicella arctica]